MDKPLVGKTVQVLSQRLDGVYVSKSDVLVTKETETTLVGIFQEGRTYHLGIWNKAQIVGVDIFLTKEEYEEMSKSSSKEIEEKVKKEIKTAKSVLPMKPKEEEEEEDLEEILVKNRKTIERKVQERK